MNVVLPAVALALVVCDWFAVRRCKRTELEARRQSVQIRLALLQSQAETQLALRCCAG